jgi:BirA family biotin operon repressor/biotin-[acetyl-CoA-carboxylase] ligase
MDLEASRIEAELVRLGAAIGRPLSLALETGSTNEDARRAASAGAPHGAAFLADAQTAGRGRGTHTWHSPPGANLYLSIVLRPRVTATEVAPITLAVGLAVARAVRRAVVPVADGALAGTGDVVVSDEARERGRSARTSSPRVTLKWPNDVLVEGRKIAGVLVEGQLRGDRVASLVAGIGLNVRTIAFPPELESTATSLALAGAAALDRSLLAAALLAEVGAVVQSYEAERLAALIDEIRALDFLRDRNVEVGSLRGVACGIDDRGCLLVRSPSGDLRAVASGEVAFRG